MTKFVSVLTNFMILSHLVFAQVKVENVGDLNLSLGGIGFLSDKDRIAPGGILANIGYEIQMPGIWSAIEPRLGYSRLGSGREYDNRDDLFAQDYEIDMFLYGLAYKFIYNPMGDGYFAFILDNDFSFANISATIQDEGTAPDKSRKAKMNGKFFYSFRLGFDFRMPEKNLVAAIRPWLGITTLNLTDFFNEGLPVGTKRFSAQDVPFTFGLSLMLF